MNRTRREFLKTTAGTSALLSLSAAVPSVLTRAAAAAESADRRNTVLVVLQLSGGNDGLNTVAPYADDAYGRARRTLRLTRKDVHVIDDYQGFHPRMKGFARLFKQGRLGIVQGVGYPKSDRSHPGAMRDWHTAMPGKTQYPTGWVGRAIDSVAGNEPGAIPGVFVGPIATPLAMTARNACVPSIRSSRDLTLRKIGDATLFSPSRHGVGARSGRENRVASPILLEHVGRAAAAASETSRRIQTVLAGAPGADRYPNQSLAKSLKTAAELIRADVGIRIVFVELGGGGIGGFDNHAIQRDNHAAVLGQLSDSVTAFCDDLARDKTLDRVCLMTFSEFGRTLSENGRRGTGHGAAAPVFIVGGRVRGGLIGKPPSLADLDGDAPKHHTDYRRLYATVLSRWLGFDSKTILGARYTPLDLFVA